MEIEYEKLPKKAKYNKSYAEDVIEYATNECSYNIEKIDYNIGMVRLKGDYANINIYLTTFTITTEFKVPGIGKVQRNEKGMTIEELKERIKLPRKGYETTQTISG